MLQDYIRNVQFIKEQYSILFILIYLDHTNTNMWPALKKIVSIMQSEANCPVIKQYNSRVYDLMCSLISSLLSAQHKISAQQQLQSKVERIINQLNYQQYPSQGPICGKYASSSKYYRCLDCHSSRVEALLCEGCFDYEKHSSHHFQIVYQKQYYCDCGDINLLKAESLCIRHRAQPEENKMAEGDAEMFKHEFNFLLYVSLTGEYNKEVKKRRREKTFQEITIDRLKQLAQSSYEYRKMMAKILLQPFESPYVPKYSTILRQILEQCTNGIQLIKQLYTIKQARSKLMQQLLAFLSDKDKQRWVSYRSIFPIIFREVDIITQLLQQRRIPPLEIYPTSFRYKQLKILNYFNLHSIMKGHKNYSSLVCVLVRQSMRGSFFEVHPTSGAQKSQFIQRVKEEHFPSFILEAIKAICQRQQSKELLLKMIRQAYSFVTQKPKETSIKVDWQPMYAQYCLAVCLLAYLDYDLTKLYQISSDQLFQILGEQQDIIIVQESYCRRIIQICRRLQFPRKHSHNRAQFIKQSFDMLRVRVWLTFQYKIQQEFKRDYLILKLLLQNTSDSTEHLNNLAVIINILSAAQGDLPVLVISQELGHPKQTQFVQFYRELDYILEGLTQIEKKTISQKYLNRFQQLSINTILLNGQSTTSVFQGIPIINPTIFQKHSEEVVRRYKLRLLSHHRSQLSMHFFSKEVEDMLGMSVSFTLQLMMQVASDKQGEMLNSVTALHLLLFAETKYSFTRQTIRRLINHYKQMRIQPLEAIRDIFSVIEQEDNKLIQEKNKQVQQKNEALALKKKKLLSKMKDSQKIILENLTACQLIAQPALDVDDQFLCLLCKLPGNLMTICSVQFKGLASGAHLGTSQRVTRITSCGHMVHQQCCKPTKRTIEISPPERRGDRRGKTITTTVYKCSYCRQIGNVLLPKPSTFNIEQQRQLIDSMTQMEEKCLDIYEIELLKSKRKVDYASYDTDQLFFQAMLYQIYLFFFSHAKYYQLTMLKAHQNIIEYLRWRIERRLAFIRPANILAPELLFYRIQEMLVLLLYHDRSVQTQLISQLERKVEELPETISQEQGQIVQLIKLCLRLMGKDADLGSHVQVERLRLFKPPEDLYDLYCQMKQCEHCSKRKRRPFLTNKMRICLVCGFKYCSCCSQAIKNHSHQKMSYALLAESGIMQLKSVKNGGTAYMSLYKNDHGEVLDKKEPKWPKKRGLFKFDSTAYEHAVKSMLSQSLCSEEFKIFKTDRELPSIAEDFQTLVLYFQRTIQNQLGGSIRREQRARREQRLPRRQQEEW